MKWGDRVDRGCKGEQYDHLTSSRCHNRRSSRQRGKRDKAHNQATQVWMVKGARSRFIGIRALWTLEKQGRNNMDDGKGGRGVDSGESGSFGVRE